MSAAEIVALALVGFLLGPIFVFMAADAFGAAIDMWADLFRWLRARRRVGLTRQRPGTGPPRKATLERP